MKITVTNTQTIELPDDLDPDDAAALLETANHASPHDDADEGDDGDESPDEGDDEDDEDEDRG